MMYAPETENSNGQGSAVQIDAVDMTQLLRDGILREAKEEYPHWDADQLRAYSAGVLSYWICQAISENRYARELAKEVVMDLIRKGMEAHK